MFLVLDTPVTSIVRKQLFRARFLGRQTGNDADDLGSGLFRVVDDLGDSLDTSHLCAMWEIDEAGQLRTRPDPPDLDASVRFLLRFMLRGK